MGVSVEVIKYLADSQTPNKPAVIIIQWIFLNARFGNGRISQKGEHGKGRCYVIQASCSFVVSSFV